MKNEEHPEILEVIAYLKYESIKKVLYQYFKNLEHCDFYLTKSFVLGFLNFDCSEYQEEFKMEIEKCYYKGLFNEFIPALACKIEDNKEILEKLYLTGNENASTDCISGIILGLSLSKNGKNYLEKILFNPVWETCNAGTGNLWQTYFAFKKSGMRFSELFDYLEKLNNTDKIENALEVIFSLLKLRVKDYDDNEMESFEELLKIFFHNDDNRLDLLEIADKVNEFNEARHLENILEIKITEELFIDRV
ncbi:hypothetical protein [Aureivirga sp. CE67]|uniref:hypothetical protein n=1 Tax=Aureivirga sp. CE67 TaxID=1788983 RepID=UPI0018C937C3|nr:hypothetical protein [Aureivirga sp. CE67]